ncbi:MAG: 4Fe-4S binding protein [Desulfoplanes sp.]|nr:4Fe-4S binding protein [Desulfoplanes sp.]MDD4648546.1 4Fe-4S binding protein [Desulfoplanes sp.]
MQPQPPKEDSMSRIVIQEDRCKGCLLCTQVCPTNIIAPSNRFNQQGYKVVEIPEGKMNLCKGCAFCAEICPDYAITVFRTKKSPDKGEE